ncbi:MAG TPA: hypothetical protein VK489_12530 [Ferruginibacter sp.]|nr:hypothetical protein [Ferruginibacter sp.]
MNTKILSLTFLVTFTFTFMGCNNSSETKTDQTRVLAESDSIKDYGPQIEDIEKRKAEIEKMAAVFSKKEIDLRGTTGNASLKQKWAKMDVYSDSSGIRKIKVYPHPGVSQRSEEFYFDDGKMFFTFIADSGLHKENYDEGIAGKEFHFLNGKLIRYYDRSGEKEANPEEQKKIYELKLPAEARELYLLAGGK